ncbi:hypothetical protein B0O80DRAFT_259366 [Mortierella sp. GBAus27b]|nr:hypothetical protein B0O80DRAFT_259366 [Mortierella sp. GBAus27b]
MSFHLISKSWHSRTTKWHPGTNKLAVNNNQLACKNNEMASSTNEMALKITELTSSNMESTAMVIKLQEQFNVKQDEMKQLQIQALNQHALLQNRVQALMNQTYELHEYPIPRLFVVLPQDTSSWGPMDFVSNKFRLYFLCECGDHTRRTASKIPHHIHLAKHEGYEITRPKEFFQQYGHNVLTVLKMLKFGVSVAGVRYSSCDTLSPDRISRSRLIKSEDADWEPPDRNGPDHRVP